MGQSRVYFNNIDIGALNELLPPDLAMKSNEYEGLAPEKNLTPEIASIVVVSISSLATVINAVLLYYSTVKKKGVIRITSRSGRTMEFLSGIDEVEKRKLIDLLDESENYQATATQEEEKI